MNKEQLKEIRMALQKIVNDMQDLMVIIERLKAEEEAEDQLEEDKYLAAMTPPPPPSPNFTPMQTRAAASAIRMPAPLPINHSGWLATLADLASVSPKNKMGQ